MMKRSDFVLFICLVLCAVAVVHTQHRARRVFVDLEREKTMGDELAADLRRLQAERATLVASNRVEHVASEMKMRLPDSRSVIVMGNQSKDLAEISNAAKTVALASEVLPNSPLTLLEPTLEIASGHAPKTKQSAHSVKRGKQ